MKDVSASESRSNDADAPGAAVPGFQNPPAAILLFLKQKNEEFTVGKLLELRDFFGGGLSFGGRLGGS
jgi:hypothetical protein